MIWFTCKQCRKTLCRPATSAGTFVFCDCGQGMPVPWESEAQEQESLEVIPAAPTIEPLLFEPVIVETPVLTNEPRFDRPARPPKNACFNHEAVATEVRCKDCGELFCPDCLVHLQGQPVCGPCKNQRARGYHRPIPAAPTAIWSAFLAIVSAPLAGFLIPYGASWALIPEIGAILLGYLALRKIERDSQFAGQALAIIGVLVATFAVMWTVFLTFYADRLWV